MSYDAPNHNHTNIFSHLICHFSDLEKAAKEIAPKEDLIDPKILYPAFAASMIANILMGGHILSQVTMQCDATISPARSIYAKWF